MCWTCSEMPLPSLIQTKSNWRKTFFFLSITLLYNSFLNRFFVIFSVWLRFVLYVCIMCVSSVCCFSLYVKLLLICCRVMCYCLRFVYLLVDWRAQPFLLPLLLLLVQMKCLLNGNAAFKELSYSRFMQTFLYHFHKAKQTHTDHSTTSRIAYRMLSVVSPIYILALHSYMPIGCVRIVAWAF